MEKRLAT
jgi:hypothetical protein